MTSLDAIVNRHRNSIRGRRELNNSLTALRAVIAARLVASGQAGTAKVAAVCTNSAPAYVRAAVVVLKAEDEPLLDAVLRGEKSLLQAAKRARRVANLVNAYRAASDDDLVATAKILGGIIVPERAAYREAAE